MIAKCMFLIKSSAREFDPARVQSGTFRRRAFRMGRRRFPLGIPLHASVGKSLRTRCAAVARLRRRQACRPPEPPEIRWTRCSALGQREGWAVLAGLADSRGAPGHSHREGQIWRIGPTSRDAFGRASGQNSAMPGNIEHTLAERRPTSVHIGPSLAAFGARCGCCFPRSVKRALTSGNGWSILGNTCCRCSADICENIARRRDKRGRGLARIS